jgi:DNA-directed RNA polymerase specialized sigma24 family protein
MSESDGGGAWGGSRRFALPVTKPTGPVRPRTEIAAAIRAFTPAQWARLRSVAAHYAIGRPMEADDLLQEAFRLALDGERECPVAIDVVRFLAEAMRSIANGELKKAKRRLAVVPRPPPGRPETPVPDPPDSSPNAEQQREAAEDEAEEDARHERQRQQIIGLFADDTAAQVIVEGLMEGTRGEDLRGCTDLDQTAYQSKRRLIRRRSEKFLKGLKP